MRTYVSVTAVALAAGLALAAGGLIVACTVNSTTNNANPGGSVGDDDAETTNTDSGTDGATVTTDAGADAADGDDGAVPQAFVRVAHWSPDAPTLDVCFNPPGGSWSDQTPQFGQLLAAAATDAGAVVDANASDAGDAAIATATGVNFPQVTSYLIIPPGTYAVRLVAAGAADCTTSVIDLPTSAVLSANTYTTVAALGEVTPVGTDAALKLVSFNDDVTAPAAQIALRFINASPSSSLTQADLGTGSLVGNPGGVFAPLFTGVAFGAAGTSPATDAATVDPNGYLAEAPLTGATLSVHATAGAQDTTTALNDVNVASGAATIALIDGISNGIAADAAQLLLCADVDDSTSTSLFAQCSVISTQ
jgi:Domain of unknown function (DUF4397)